MKPKQPKLPAELEAFIQSGNTTFACEDGDWDLRIAPRDSSDFRDELPARSVMIAENGSGDCLFLKASADGKVGSKVFVFWHEEDRSEAFANHVKELTRPAPPERSAPPASSSEPKPTVPLDELEAALRSSDWKVRNETMKKFSESAYGLEALPVLRKALNNDDVVMVIRAAECIGTLGPEAASCPAGQENMCGERDLESQLMRAGSKVWSYSGYSNSYSACLNALVKLKVNPDFLIEHVHQHIGLGSPDDLINSLNALKAVGSPDALDLLKRAAAFWLPELNMKYTKQVNKLVEEAGAQRRRG